MDSNKVNEIEDILYEQVKLLAEHSKNNDDSETIRKITETILNVRNLVF